MQKERPVQLKTDQGKETIKQTITFISPYSVRVESTRFDWTLHYLTSVGAGHCHSALARSRTSLPIRPTLRSNTRSFVFALKPAADFGQERTRTDFAVNSPPRKNGSRPRRSLSQPDVAAQLGRGRSCGEGRETRSLRRADEAPPFATCQPDCKLKLPTYERVRNLAAETRTGPKR